MTYAEFLKQNGATEDVIKILDTLTARQNYDAMEARVAQADAIRTTAETQQRNLDTWFKNEATPYVSKVEQAATIAKANEARAIAIVRDLEARGLVDKEALKEFGIDPVAAAPPPGGAPPPDVSKFVTLDSMKPALDSVGNNLAAMQDLVLEHMQLFPNQPLRVRELRNEANAKGLGVYEYWEQKFGVVAARTAAETARQTAHDDAMRAEGAKARETELISKFSNPETRPLSPSTSPLAYRPTGDRSGKQPWDVGTPESLSSERVTRVATKLLQSGVSN